MELFLFIIGKIGCILMDCDYLLKYPTEADFEILSTFSCNFSFDFVSVLASVLFLGVPN